MGFRAEPAGQFEGQRAHLRAVAHRILGSPTEADDAVQETWLRLQRAGADGIDNLPGWLTTVVSRICLDMLRSRRTRRETLAGTAVSELDDSPAQGADPEREAVLADSVGRALLIVLETLTPAERVAFVLHDVFAVPFTDIAPVLDRSPEAAKKLAGRARRRVQAADTSTVDVATHRRVIDALLAAIRHGDTDAVLAVLAPDVVRRVDPVLLPPGIATEVHGARSVAEEARTFSGPARFARVAWVDGRLGAVVSDQGAIELAITFCISGSGLIEELEVIGERARLDRLTVEEAG